MSNLWRRAVSTIHMAWWEQDRTIRWIWSCINFRAGLLNWFFPWGLDEAEISIQVILYMCRYKLKCSLSFADEEFQCPIHYTTQWQWLVVVYCFLAWLKNKARSMYCVHDKQFTTYGSSHSSHIFQNGHMHCGG